MRGDDDIKTDSKKDSRNYLYLVVYDLAYKYFIRSEKGQILCLVIFIFNRVAQIRLFHCVIANRFWSAYN